MSGISVAEFRPGVLKVSIKTSDYGDAGQHWKRTLSGPDNGGYGKIYIQRDERKRRQYWHTVGMRTFFLSEKGVNQDECPGAMFIWTALRYPSIEAVDAVHNQRLGRDMGAALQNYPQRSPKDLWEVTFAFL